MYSITSEIYNSCSIDKTQFLHRLKPVVSLLQTDEEKCDHLKFEDILKECKDDKIRAILVFIEEKFGIKGVDVEKEDELLLVTDDGTELTIYKGISGEKPWMMKHGPCIRLT